MQSLRSNFALFATLALLGGCATVSTTPFETYNREHNLSDAQLEADDGLRYERGAALLEAGHAEFALRDFKALVDKGAKDGDNNRYPHRELGIAYYELARGMLGEVTEGEVSNARRVQMQTYIDLARRSIANSLEQAPEHNERAGEYRSAIEVLAGQISMSNDTDRERRDGMARAHPYPVSPPPWRNGAPASYAFDRM